MSLSSLPTITVSLLPNLTKKAHTAIPTTINQKKVAGPMMMTQTIQGLTFRFKILHCLAGYTLCLLVQAYQPHNEQKARVKVRSALSFCLGCSP